MDKARIEEILDESLSDPSASDVRTQKVWLSIAIHRKVVKKHEAEMRELLETWPVMRSVLKTPALIRQVPLRTFQRELGTFYTFLLLAFGQEAGWWTVTAPSEEEGYENITEMMRRSGFIQPGK